MRSRSYHSDLLSRFKDEIVHIEYIPRREARFGDTRERLKIEGVLRELSLFPLYVHQARCVDLVREGKNVIVSTPSASGKSLCYIIPITEAFLERDVSALLLYPTKALSQDQVGKISVLFERAGLNVKPFIFDGDTPQDERAYIRRRGKVVLSNPDMLHIGILPNHKMWGRFFSKLSFVVLDEAHVYKGVFGSHTANIIRRLRRICELYGSKPLFILCSATISNPGEHAERLCGLPFEVVMEDGSPYGGKEFIFWNPRFIGERRRSPVADSVVLLEELIRRGIRTIGFVKTRRLCELLYMRLRERLGDLSSKVKPYRGGYMPEERREIEKGLFSGELLGVISTSALELGIDIGDLDATVITGYPGSVSSTWQMAGRSGRRGEVSLSFLLASENPLDQYIISHPEDFFSRSPESALINPDNPYILSSHILCAAWELPISERDEAFFGEGMWEIIKGLEGDFLKERGGKWFLSPKIYYPAQDVNIRSSEKNYLLIEDGSGRLLETIDGGVALSQIHPGAIYLHQGETYFVKELDLEKRIARAIKVDVDYYTEAKEIEEINVLRERKGEDVIHFGDVRVTKYVIGYVKKRVFTDEVVGEELLELPPEIFETEALWLDFDEDILRKVRGMGLDVMGGLHGIEHAMIALLPFFALCDRNDIGGVSTTFHPDTGRAEVFIYDAHPGGIGIALEGYRRIWELLKATLDVIKACPCENGCPGCIQSPKCGNNNEPLDKEASKIILEEMLKEYPRES